MCCIEFDLKLLRDCSHFHTLRVKVKFYSLGIFISFHSITNLFPIYIIHLIPELQLDLFYKKMLIPKNSEEYKNI